MPRKGWNVPAERPENRSVEDFTRKLRNDSRDAFPRNLIRNEDKEDTHDMVTGDNESPIIVPEFRWRTPISGREQYVIIPTVNQTS